VLKSPSFLDDNVGSEAIVPVDLVCRICDSRVRIDQLAEHVKFCGIAEECCDPKKVCIFCPIDSITFITHCSR